MARILLIEDEALVRESISAVLRKDGHEVAVAGDGAEALRAIARDSFDLIITDIVMPQVEGIEVIRAIRARHRDCPVIAISGGGAIDKGEMLDWAAKFGATATLAKPFTAQALRAAVASCLG